MYKYGDFVQSFLHDVANESITSYRDFKLLVNLRFMCYSVIYLLVCGPFEKRNEIVVRLLKHGALVDLIIHFPAINHSHA